MAVAEHRHECGRAQSGGARPSSAIDHANALETGGAWRYRRAINLAQLDLRGSPRLQCGYSEHNQKEEIATDSAPPSRWAGTESVRITLYTQHLGRNRRRAAAPMRRLFLAHSPGFAEITFADGNRVVA